MSHYTRRLPPAVEAIRLIHPITLDAPSGPVHGDVGDYLVTEGVRQYIVPRAEFERSFQEQANLVITPVVQPQIVPMPYPIYVQPRPWCAQPTWAMPTITTSGASQTTLQGTVTAINQGAVNAHLMHGGGTISGMDAALSHANTATATLKDGSYSIGD